jgi:hypothetical protein
MIVIYDTFNPCDFLACHFNTISSFVHQLQVNKLSLILLMLVLFDKEHVARKYHIHRMFKFVVEHMLRTLTHLDAHLSKASHWTSLKLIQPWSKWQP